MEKAVQIADYSIEKVLVQNEELRCSIEAKDHQIKLLGEMSVYLRDGKSLDDLLPWNIDPEELKRLVRRD